MKPVHFLTNSKKLFGILCLSSLLICNLQAQTFSTERLEVFYDDFLGAEALIADERVHNHPIPPSPPGPTPTPPSPPVVTTPPPAILGFAPMVIENNTGLDSSRLYLVGKGQTLAATDAYFLQPNTTTGICTLVSSATNNSADPSISVKLSLLPSAGTNTYFVYVPQMISGRFYLSVDKPLYMETVTVGGINKINDPSQTTVQDPNYYTLYQDFEFTLDVHYDLYANVTNVDYFSLPLTMASYSYPTGDFYPTLDNLTQVGYPPTALRSSILSNIKAVLANDASNPPQWSTLAVPYYQNPYVLSAQPATDLRILAAKLGIALGQNGVSFQGAANTQTYFNPNYLQSTTSGPSSGTSYMQQLFNYYRTPNTLQITIFPASLPQATYTMSSLAGTTLQFVSTTLGAPTPITLDLNTLTTTALLSGAVGEWATSFSPSGTNAYNTEIAKTISALFSAGKLPPDSSMVQPIVSEASYFSTYRNSYFTNPAGFSQHGPWYNLYDKAIHPLLLNTGGYGLGYAYDFDDLLDIAGLLHVNIQTAGVSNSAQPYVALTAAKIDTVIPNTTANFGPYTLNVSILPLGSNPIDIIYSTNSAVAPNQTYSLITSSSGILNSVTNYFLVKYYTDNSKTSSETYQVYPKYQLVLPTTTRYNSQDIALMNGISFGTGTNATIINIALPNTSTFPR